MRPVTAIVTIPRVVSQVRVANCQPHPVRQDLLAGVIHHPRLGLARGEGSWVWDVAGRRYLDFTAGLAVAALGHGRADLAEALREQFATLGHCSNLYGNIPALELARRLVDSSFAARIWYANSGTEATLGAIRIARGHAKKPKILKFEGHFHGMLELIWYNCATPPGEVRADGTIAPVPDTDGMPAAFADLVVVVPFNHPDAFQRAVAAHGKDLAAVIVEPISYNQGCIPALPEFLRLVRDTCTRQGIVLIFDEVLSGFRMCRGGAQEYFGVTPDLCTLAKALGGGVPIAAVCGKSDVMSVLNPTGRTIMSGTYTGHLTAVMGAIACQTEIAKPDFYPHITGLADRLYRGITEALRVTGVPGLVQGIGARFGIYLGVTEPVTNYRQAARTDRQMEVKFILGCVKRGLYIHDYGHTMHHGFSAQHTQADIDQALGIIEDALRDI